MKYVIIRETNEGKEYLRGINSTAPIWGCKHNCRNFNNKKEAEIMCLGIIEEYFNYKLDGPLMFTCYIKEIR
jgi:hypothetical protein